ncbi:ACL166Wp [Eremothecium gossypii ATCC 10895]|uniref:chitinase n=1 Tax=Eremothecium gossypii (strain ATCC 10895 / CBS 109.51 / FGSC 9923 / NRRL Y-1056) TaxID=284811 RepID=Q75CT5_EREGS|nr:ACL166Wp [Eremothecium gossypii ATCC 10895]AAS51062.1 ACL166Wp [Eremothecium gossypii ATCC 10895]AEY95352.1 FACL166Wp [Eremothecium gossypii FDAG1]
MRRFPTPVYTIWILILVAAIVLEMTFLPKLIKEKLSRRIRPKPLEVHEETRPVPDAPYPDGEYTVGVYYSSWSPYKPRLHYPRNIDFQRVTHVYYAFFVVDEKTGKIGSLDKWSDTKMPMNLTGMPRGLNGAIGELNYLKTRPGTDFKLMMAVGGWSNREPFHKIVRDEEKFNNFIDSAIDAMFEYGFDGIDLDWEFPKDDGYEPQMYLEMCSRLRHKMDELEDNIWGPGGTTEPRFHLSMAAPAFPQTLGIFPVEEMNKYLSMWNMMTYDYHGAWSERTGYHSNLYNATNSPYKSHLDKRRYEDMGIDNFDELNAHDAILMMTEQFKVSPRKIALGMAAYGRGFTNVRGDGEQLIGQKYSGVGGGSEGEPGMWLYNQLPLAHGPEKFDNVWVSAYSYDPNTKTLVVYDNVDSMKIKKEYVKDKKLAGAFLWESCGDNFKDKDRNLVEAFTENMKGARKATAYKDSKLIQYYLRTRPEGFLVPMYRHTSG